MNLDKDLLKEMIDKKYVSVQKHPDAELYIYNYTNSCQYERMWNEITLQCRGLILDKDFNVVAKPFSKFFNIEEHTNDEIPNLPFDVFEKMDGSLGIVFYYKNKWLVATRGSFTSEQSIKASELLKKYNLEALNKNNTYLFEIIF